MNFKKVFGAILVIALVAVLVVKRNMVGSLYVLLKYKASPDAPEITNKQMKVPGLRSAVKIRFDAHGVPHIEAKNHLDLMKSVGYIHGAFRFFQMDMLRRVSQGRLSEALGKKPMMGRTTVDFDIAMRGWGLAQKAKQGWSKLTKKQQQEYIAYCEGVNSALKTYTPIEYRLLGLTPEKWTPNDMLSVGLLNGWTISHNWQQELARFLIALRVGPKEANQLYPHKDMGSPSIAEKEEKKTLPPGIVPEMVEWLKRKSVSITKKPQRKVVASVMAQILPILSSASNAWAASGKHTKSGKPVLAADPHLSHLLPSIIFPIHLKTPDMDVIGVTFPGLPYVLMGHNKHVAWGITSAVADAMDLVLEKPDKANKGFVVNESKKCPIRTVLHKVRVKTPKGVQVVQKSIRETCNGPILNDFMPNLFPKEKELLLAVRWRPKQLQHTLQVLRKVNQAKDVHSLKKAFGSLPGLVVAVTAADTQGNIALFWTGAFPIRKHHRGTFPVPGWKAKYEWQGFSKPDDSPSVVNPTKGTVAHANNLIVDPRKAKFLYQIDSAPAYRVNRINELLKKTTAHTTSSFAKIQKDLFVTRAKSLLPVFIAELDKSKALFTSQEKVALEKLRAWDKVATKNSIGTTVFFKTYFYAMRNVVRQKLPSEGFPFFMGQRYSGNAVDRWFADGNHAAWKNTKRSAVLSSAFRKAVKNLQATLGKNIEGWRWGSIHKTNFKHFFGRRPGLGFFSLKLDEGHGAPSSVWKSQFNFGHPKTPFYRIAGPVYRMVIDLNHVNKAKWVIDTGMSGWPGTKHYGDQHQKWKQGKLIPMLFDWNNIRQSKLPTWTLTMKK